MFSFAVCHKFQIKCALILCMKGAALWNSCECSLMLRMKQTAVSSAAAGLVHDACIHLKFLQTQRTQKTTAYAIRLLWSAPVFYYRTLKGRRTAKWQSPKRQLKREYALMRCGPTFSKAAFKAATKHGAQLSTQQTIHSVSYASFVKRCLVEEDGAAMWHRSTRYPCIQSFITTNKCVRAYDLTYCTMSAIANCRYRWSFGKHTRKLV